MKISRLLTQITLATAVAAMTVPDAAVAVAAEQTRQSSKKGSAKGTQKTTSAKAGGNKSAGTKSGSTKTYGTKTSGTKSGGKRKSSGKPKKAASTSGSTGTESAEEVRRRQEATQREISDTKKQIKANDISIKKGVDELGRLQGDISESREKVKTTAAEVSTLGGKIGTIEGQVSSEEKQLEKLRAEYLKAIKKMRKAGKSNSTLAFIFSSGSFNQALRRMRYLKQFSEWKDRQSAEIAGKVAHLKGQRDLLAKTKNEKDKALKAQQTAQRELEGQYARQDAIVVELRANGEALNAHLAKKQAEANALRNRISALIAAEEAARRERERQAQEEARRQQEAEEARRRQQEERERAEQQARQEAEQARIAAEKDRTEVPALKQAENQPEKKADRKVEKKTDKKAENRHQTSKNKKDTKKQEPRKAETPKQEPKKQETKKQDSKDYANARKRPPRSGSQNGSAPAAPTSAPATKTQNNGAGGFEKMRGSLPKPVAGSFKITSPFGRHSLPELPDVMYDNPGIDAQVAPGAQAQAVYAGKVSGVYMIPGFSTVVIINHGNYYTVYGNIASPAVKVGDTVKQGQGLGQLATDEEDSAHSSIHFEVWRNRDKLNPTDWIR